MPDLDLLTLTQWLSPSYPVGAFSYSHGLETAISDGRIRTSQDLENWLSSVIEQGSGWTDLVLLSAAHKAASEADLQEISDLAKALCPSKERLAETVSQGAAFVRTTNAIWDTKLADYPYPVAVGAAASHQKIDLETTTYLFSHSFASNLISGAVRLIPLGQTDGQACLHRLTPLCAEVAKSAICASLENAGSAAFASDIASMTHETQKVRIFQS